MITRNWYNGFKAYSTRSTIKNGLTALSGKTYDVIPAPNTSNYWYLFITRLNLNWNTGNSDTGGTGIGFGSGTTPPTIDDYKLESAISKGLSFSFVQSYGNPCTWIITITNTSDKEITIAELGMFTSIYSSYNNNSAISVLVDRTVLDTPVTIPSGGIGKIEYAIKINLPIDEA